MSFPNPIATISQRQCHCSTSGCRYCDKPIIVSVDGNIGSGKSTKVQDLKRFYEQKGRKDILFIQEPVDTWDSVVDKDGTPILVNYYKDNKRFAFRLQMLAYISRLKLLRDAIKQGYKYIITERCVATDRNVFSKMLYDKGDIEQDEYIIYNKWFEEFITDVPIGAIVYIKANPDVCLERVNVRAREGENIPIEYLQECSKYHDEWIDKENVPKLVIDANRDFNQNPESREETLKMIDEFIHSL